MRHLLKLVGLSHKENHYPSTLSGGQRQRVAIARALASNPILLLCDEFTSALDPETTLEILSLLKDLNRDLGVSIALITHDMTVVREICDDVYVLDQGKIVESGSLETVFLSPHHRVTKGLLRTLFLKELPHHLKDSIKVKPSKECHVVLRLIFAGDSAQSPVIAELIKKFNINANIIAGNLDHLREKAFGCLIITLPYEKTMFTKIKTYFAKKQVVMEEMGFINQL